MALGTLTFAAVLVALLGVWLSHRLAQGREDSKARNEARVEFRTVIEPIVVAIREERRDPHAIVSADRARVDAAIAAFRPHLKARDRASFDSSVSKYAAVAQNLQPGMITFYETLANGKSDGPERVQRVVTALDNLLQFAK